MNYFSKNKWWALAVAILFAANIVTLIIFWTVKTSPPPPPFPPNAPPQAGQPAAFLVEELKLNATQQKQFDELRKEHQQQVRAIRDSIRVAKDLFFDLIKKEKITDADLQQSSSRSASYQQQLDMVTFKHFQKVRAICTPEQQQKFDKIIHDVTRQMAPQPPPPPGAGHPTRPGNINDDRPPGPPPPGHEPPE